MDNLDLLELWYRALRAEHGIAIVTTDRPKLIRKLLEARKNSDSAELADLMAIDSPHAENEVWITRRKATSDAER